MTHPWRESLLFVVAISLAAPAWAQKEPTPETLKQVLEKRLLTLTPAGTTARTVLFQEVRAGKANAGSFPFQVTALIRDYGPGYPANRYYGETCVGRMNQWVFTLTIPGMK